MTFDEWMQVYTLYSQRSTEQRKNIISKSPFFLRDRVYCSKCHAALKVKNQQSTNKKTGAIYGDSWYICHSAICNYKIRISTLHEECKRLLSRLLNHHSSDLFKLAEQQRRQLLFELNHKQQILEKQMDDNLELQHLVEQKLNDILPKNKALIIKPNINEQLTFIEVLRDYLRKLQNEYLELQQQLDEVRRSIELYEASNCKLELEQMLTSPHFSVNKDGRFHIQRILLHLIEKVVITPDLSSLNKKVLEKVHLSVTINSSVIHST